MQMDSYVTTQIVEWEIAGFYYIAAPMKKNASLVFESPMTEKCTKDLKHSREKMNAILAPLKKDKRFKSYYKNKNKMFVSDQNFDVKLKLIKNIKNTYYFKNWEKQ